ncbi:hypothetical protein Tco_1100828, partial [Tanacetum coccineum]
VLEELLKLSENTECAIAKPSMTMTKENGNGVQVTHAGRIRWRKGSNEASSSDNEVTVGEDEDLVTCNGTSTSDTNPFIQENKETDEDLKMVENPDAT